MLLDKCPVTTLNRKYYPSHSVFDTSHFNQKVHTVFLHKNAGIKTTTLDFDSENKVLTADMRPQEYDEFWAQLWGRKLPALVVSLAEGPRDATFATVDLARADRKNQEKTDDRS